MRSIDADNLDKIAHECRGFLRGDIIKAIEAGAAEIDRLQGAVIDLQKKVRSLKHADTE